MRHDAAHWDARYADPERAPFVEPDDAVVALMEGMPRGRGRALDLGCGEGRHALWLAAQGWLVTAVDFSHTGIRTGQELAQASGLAADITWVVADVTTWQPDESVDLVLVSLFRLEEEDLIRVRSWVAPGGHLLLVAHGDGLGGPRDPRFRSSADALRAAAGDLDVVCSTAFAAEGRRGRGGDRVAVLARRLVER
jgi:SAM-dependent methyltransferase